MRRATLSIVETSQMMSEARLFVSRHRWIYCIGKASLPEGWKAKDAITASVRLLLDVKPYLTMLSNTLPKRPPLHH